MIPKYTGSRWRQNPGVEAAGAIIGVVVIFAGVFTAFGIVLGDATPAKPASETTSKPIATKLAPEFAWRTIAPKLSNAEQKSLQASDKYAVRVQAFFAERKKGSRPFAEDALSIQGKWAFARSKFPGARGNEQSVYLRERFEQRIFSADELKQLIDCS